MFAVAHRPDSGRRVAIPVENAEGQVTAVIAFTPRLHNERERGVYLTARMRVVQRALFCVNFALNRLERFNKERIEDSALSLAGPTQKATNVFVAHKFTPDLLENLQEQLGRVTSSFEFRFPEMLTTGGLLYTAIHEELSRAQLGLYEMSHPNNNVYYELGYGIGINLPGMMFIRTPTGHDDVLPPLLKGIKYLAYGDYTGLIEKLTGHLEDLLRRYVNRRHGKRHLHFLQSDLPPSSRRRNRYAVVLDHNHFADAGDYRPNVAAGLAKRGLEPVFVLDDETDALHLVKGHKWGQRLLDLYVLVKHSELVICRCEDAADSIDAAQAFLGLGIADGLGRPVLLTRKKKDANGADLGVPADLSGLSTLGYMRLSQLEDQIARARISKFKKTGRD
jgi:hypothetical protein